MKQHNITTSIWLSLTFVCVSSVFDASDLTCTLSASSEFCEVSSSICLCNSATIPGSAGPGEDLVESASSWEVASFWAGEALDRLESSFSAEEVQGKKLSCSIWYYERFTEVYESCFTRTSVHTWQIKHFIYVIRVAGPSTMDFSQLLHQLVPFCLCLLETLLHLGQLQCINAHRTTHTSTDHSSQ